MIRATLTAFALLASPVAAQESEPFVTTDYRGHTIALYDNGTWAFTDPDVSLSGITAFADGGCLATAGGRVSFCGLPEGFSADRHVSSGRFQEYGFTDRSTGISFLLTLEDDYGHAGDLGYYRSISGGGGGIMETVIEWMVGIEMEAERAYVRDDIVVVEEGFRLASAEGAGLADFSINVLTETQSLIVSTSAFGSTEGAGLPNLDDTVARLTANLSIDGKPLAEWKAAE
ncbi:hypothetical protein KUV47_05855 [Vannielia litorea]|uniref:hypothetical protein n=1 Tax=Vannielia litorea TaxID=1217970 RepID=UPI001C97B1C2|nr:hypothetical protein [Vannielia litorea]MBY6152728.1 hypothetical protein [Vannielia litorea]